MAKKKNKKRKGILKKIVGKVVKGAEKVNEKTGGTKLADYIGGKLAKKFSKHKKYVTETTSGKEALKSAGKVGLSIASVVGTGAIAKGALKVGGKAATKAAKKAALKKRVKAGKKYDDKLYAGQAKAGLKSDFARAKVGKKPFEHTAEYLKASRSYKTKLSDFKKLTAKRAKLREKLAVLKSQTRHAKKTRKKGAKTRRQKKHAERTDDTRGQLPWE